MSNRRTKADLERELKELRAALKLRDQIIERLLATPAPTQVVVPMPYPVPAPPPMIPIWGPSTVPLRHVPVEQVEITCEGICTLPPQRTAADEIIVGGAQRLPSGLVFGACGSMH